MLSESHIHIDCYIETPNDESLIIVMCDVRFDDVLFKRESVKEAIVCRTMKVVSEELIKPCGVDIVGSLNKAAEFLCIKDAVELSYTVVSNFDLSTLR